MKELITHIEQCKAGDKFLRYSVIHSLLRAIPNDMERLFAIRYVELEIKLDQRTVLAGILTKLREDTLNATKTN